MNTQGYRGRDPRPSSFVPHMRDNGRRAALLALEAEAAAPVAAIDQLRHPGDQATAAAGVGVPGRFALGGEAGDDERLGAAELADPLGAVAVADPRLLPAAHRHVGGEVVDQYVVDVDGAALDPAGDPFGVAALAEDRAGEAVAGVVGEAQRLLGVAHLHHADDRAEGLVAHHLHRVVDVDQDGRFEVVAGALTPLAPGQRSGAVGERVVDLVLDDRRLVGRGHRPHVLRVAGVVGALADAGDL